MVCDVKMALIELIRHNEPGGCMIEFCLRSILWGVVLFVVYNLIGRSSAWGQYDLDAITLLNSCEKIGAKFNDSIANGGGSPSCIVTTSDGRTAEYLDPDELEKYVKGEPVDAAVTSKSDTLASNSSAVEGGAGDPCSTLNQQIETCQETSQEAVDSSCNPQANGQLSSVMSMARAATNQMSATSAASIEAACSSMGDLASKANIALLAFEGLCQVSQTGCSDACEQADLMAKSYRSTCPSVDTSSIPVSKRRCTRASVALSDAGNQIQSLMAQKMNAQQCKNLTANSIKKFCKDNPGNPLCASAKNVNCSDPAVAQSDVVCICNSNPRDPRCMAGRVSTASANSVTQMNGGLDSSSAKGKSGNVSNFSLTGDGSGDGIGPMPSGMSGLPGFNSRSAGASRNLSGAVGTSQSPGDRGHGGSTVGYNTTVNNGYYGGGAGSGLGRVSTTSGGAGNRVGAQTRFNGKLDGRMGAQNKLDLRQFLPGGRLDPSRVLAGISGPDGITGPNTDLWLKVNNRYRAVHGSLLHH